MAGAARCGCSVVQPVVRQHLDNFIEAGADPTGTQRSTTFEVVELDSRCYRPMPMPCERCSALPSVCSAGATITSAFWNSLTVS